MARILITPRSITSASGHPALRALTEAGHELVFCSPGKQPDEEELGALLPGCAGYLAGVEKVSGDVLRSATDLRVISRNGTGVDNIDLQVADQLGIRVCRAEGANAQAVAELTVALMFALARAIPASDRAIKAGGWERRKGIQLHSKTLGLVGCGQIGRLVTGMALALGMDVVAYDVVPDPSFGPSPRFRFATLEEVFRQAHVISLHCPAQGDGRPIVDAAALKTMRNGVLLINAARSSLIDTEALAAAIKTERVAGAAIDVFDVEPPTGDLLAKSDEVIATPHIGALTQESVDRAVELAVENLLAHLVAM